ncbi:MAG: hypothetical protein QXZ51_00570 [Candidatus Bathyarchaeia archaeon]
MTDITEYGDVMLNAYLDEWGRRRTDSLLENGIKILAVGVAPIIKTWFNSLKTIHIFRRPQRAMKLAQTFWTLHTWVVTVPTAIIKQWSSNLKLFHVLRRPEKKMLYPQTLEVILTFRKPLRVIKIPIFINLIHMSRRPSRMIRLLHQSRLIHECYVSKPGVKKTRLFLVMGELALQLSGD